MSLPDLAWREWFYSSSVWREQVKRKVMRVEWCGHLRKIPSFFRVPKPRSDWLDVLEHSACFLRPYPGLQYFEIYYSLESEKEDQAVITKLIIMGSSGFVHVLRVCVCRDVTIVIGAGSSRGSLHSKLTQCNTCKIWQDSRTRTSVVRLGRCKIRYVLTECHLFAFRTKTIKYSEKHSSLHRRSEWESWVQHGDL